jgi:alpha-glucosidase
MSRLTFLMAMLALASAVKAENFILRSPDQSIELNVACAGKIYYHVTLDNLTILEYSPISMKLDTETLGEKPEVVSSEKKEIRETISPPYGESPLITNHCNELTLHFKKGYSLVFRAYDDGIAYRFVTQKGDSMLVINETVEYRFPSYCHGWFPEKESHETNWKYEQLFGIDPGRKLYLPLVIEPRENEGNIKISITESDVVDYPSLFLAKSRNSENWLVSRFENYPIKTETGGFNNFMTVVSQSADYIAKTEGNRNFPWRVLMIADHDKELIGNEMVYLLAEKQDAGDWSWVEPGQVVWDWWHDYNIENAGFETGINTKTYLSLIDFASEQGVPYVNIDWKWSDPQDLFLVNPDMDMEKIFAYAREKKIRICIWCLSYTVTENLNEAMDQFEKWGAAGIKVDFFGRDDQVANQMYETIAKAASKRKLLVNFHGCAKPTGLHRKYPNIINYEAVKGLEGSKFGTTITPDLDLLIPFIRQACGPLDYTPGAMRNFASGKYKVTYPPGSQGTRCHQLAMYVVYDQPLAMLCDMPSAYKKEPDYTSFLTKIPTVWDESKILDAFFGEYLVVARRNGDDWYIGALTNWTERKVLVDLSFLEEGNYNCTYYMDGINSNKLATDFNVLKFNANRESKLSLNLKQGGGAVLHLHKNKD